jgi:5'-nucleotidase
MPLNILCTNDDGYGADGLNALIEACSHFGRVFVVAPDEQYSECSHKISTRTHLLPKQEKKDQWSLNGSPADCTRLAITELITEKVDLVCSGINSGGNLGADIFYSGTVAAGREALLLDYAALSFSMVLEKGTCPNWDMAKIGAKRAIDDWINQQSPKGLWGINFPTRLNQEDHHAKDCPLEQRPLQTTFEGDPQAGYHYTGRYHNRPITAGSDVDLCFSGKITRSRIPVF